jgi:hypothetical protein
MNYAQAGNSYCKCGLGSGFGWPADIWKMHDSIREKVSQNERDERDVGRRETGGLDRGTKSQNRIVYR